MGDPFWPVLVFRPAAFRAALWAAWPMWTALAGLLFAIVLGQVLAETTSDAILFTGTTLELFGLSLIAIGLSNVRRIFKRPPFWSAIVAWLRTFIAAFQPPPPIFLSGKAALAIGGAATGTLSRGPRPDATLEERVADLEADLSALRSTVTQFSTTTRDNFVKVNRHLAEEKDARMTGDAETKATVEDFAAGGLHLEAVGVAWLLFGILGSNIPEQVARFLHHIS